MLPTRALLIGCFLVLHCDVISAAKLNFVGHFEVKETGTEQQENQPKQTQAATKKADTMTSDKVVSSPKDAAGLYKLSYQDYDLTWEQFKIDHKRVYTSAREERKRFAIFMDTVKRIERHNWQFHNGLTTYWKDINKFSDRTPEERQAFRCLLEANMTTNTQTEFLISNTGAVPESIDWRDKNYVTYVKDQDRCGCCYAISAVGAIEGQYAKHTRRLVNLSAQQVVDCSTPFGNHGCRGGSILRSFKYIQSSDGIESETAYPFTGEVGNCKFDPEKVNTMVIRIKAVPSEGDENILMSVVGTDGPVSVAICTSDDFEDYRGGIFEDVRIRCAETNHAALVVGYGTENGNDYWIVKNSWGRYWGEDGYIRIARNSKNMCKIATRPYLPIVTDY